LLPNWASIPLGVAALAAAFLVAGKRARTPGTAPASRPWRIALAGSGYGAALGLTLLPQLLAAAVGEPLGPLGVVAFKLADFFLLGAFLAGAADLLLDPLRFVRDRRAFATGLPLLVVLIAGPLLASGYSAGMLRGPEPNPAMVAAAALAAALLWWSRLPATGEETAHIFD
jgi:hypothetical protein